MCNDEHAEMSPMSTAPSHSANVLNRPRVVPILGVAVEASNTRSLSFADKLAANALPGQFGMIWAPGVDEVPMSLLPQGERGYCYDRREEARERHESATEKEAW